jgi:acyl CoA:acetate/3-ketoacid CoA transferase beta subunit
MTPASRAEVCVAACADLFRGDGEVIADAIGVIPVLGVALARLTFEPGLLVHDGWGRLLRTGDGDPVVEGWLPFRRLLDLVAGGRRHAIMGANQLDRFGNQNIAWLGDRRQPAKQLSGFRGAPGNSVNHRISYWIPRHSKRVLVDTVDVVSAAGYDRAAKAGPAAQRFHAPHRVVTNLAVLDFGGPDHAMRLLSTHPGVSVADVVANTAFEPHIGDVTPTRTPSDAELRLIRDVLDPDSRRDAEIVPKVRR